jgi:hypothetical protein
MRDFFYNKGDILIAILIILVAAFIIYVRVGIIMDYSHSGESGGSLLPKPPSVDEILDFVTGGESAGEGSQAGENAGEPSDGANTSSSEETPPVIPEGGTEAEPPPAENPPVQQAETVQIVVEAGDAASVIADKLLAAGAISDKQAFLSDVAAQGADSRLKMGTFTIPAGASHADIIAILTG